MPLAAVGNWLDSEEGGHWDSVRGVLERGSQCDTTSCIKYPDKTHFQRQEVSLWWERRRVVNGHELSFGVD